MLSGHFAACDLLLIPKLVSYKLDLLTTIVLVVQEQEEKMKQDSIIGIHINKF